MMMMMMMIFFFYIYTGCHVTGGTNGTVAILREKLNKKCRVKFRKVVLNVYRLRVHLIKIKTDFIIIYTSDFLRSGSNFVHYFF